MNKEQRQENVKYVLSVYGMEYSSLSDFCVCKLADYVDGLMDHHTMIQMIDDLHNENPRHYDA